MPRKIVPLINGSLYHIYNRGVDKRDIFFTKWDYLRFYQSLAYFNQIPAINDFKRAKANFTKSQDPLVLLHSYCLLPNHFHLILEQSVSGGIAEFMKRISGGYTLYFNTENDRTGALFEGTYKRVLIDTDEYYRYLFSYVNENHVVHNLEKPTEIYQSSTMHFSRGYRCLPLNAPPLIEVYSQSKAIELAQDIYNKRKSLKSLLHE